MRAVWLGHLGGPAAVIAAHGRQPGRMAGEEHHPGIGLAGAIRALARMLAGQVCLAASVLGQALAHAGWPTLVPGQDRQPLADDQRAWQRVRAVAIVGGLRRPAVG